MAKQFKVPASTDNLAAQKGNIKQGAFAGGEFLGSYLQGQAGNATDSGANTQRVLGSTAQYASMGASIGGPWGAAIGGTFGLAAGLMQNSALKQEAAARQRAYNNAVAQQRDVNSFGYQEINPFAAPMAKNGLNVSSAKLVEAEGDELIFRNNRLVGDLKGGLKHTQGGEPVVVKEGDWIAPAKDRKKVLAMYEQGDYESLNSYRLSLPADTAPNDFYRYGTSRVKKYEDGTRGIGGDDSKVVINRTIKQNWLASVLNQATGGKDDTGENNVKWTAPIINRFDKMNLEYLRKTKTITEQEYQNYLKSGEDVPWSNAFLAHTLEKIQSLKSDGSIAEVKKAMTGTKYDANSKLDRAKFIVETLSTEGSVFNKQLKETLTNSVIEERRDSEAYNHVPKDPGPAVPKVENPLRTEVDQYKAQVQKQAQTDFETAKKSNLDLEFDQFMEQNKDKYNNEMKYKTFIDKKIRNIEQQLRNGDMTVDEASNLLTQMQNDFIKTRQDMSNNDRKKIQDYFANLATGMVKDFNEFAEQYNKNLKPGQKAISLIPLNQQNGTVTFSAQQPVQTNATAQAAPATQPAQAVTSVQEQTTPAPATGSTIETLPTTSSTDRPVGPIDRRPVTTTPQPSQLSKTEPAYTNSSFGMVNGLPHGMYQGYSQPATTKDTSVPMTPDTKHQYSNDLPSTPAKLPSEPSTNYSAQVEATSQFPTIPEQSAVTNRPGLPPLPQMQKQDNTINALALAPALYNIGMGMSGAAEITPRYMPTFTPEQYVDTREPERAAIRAQDSANRQQVRNYATSGGQYLANMGALNSFATQQMGQIAGQEYSRMQDIQNRNAQRQDATRNSMIPQMMQADAFDAMNRAAKRNQVAAGVGQLGEYAIFARRDKNMTTANQNRQAMQNYNHELYSNFFGSR